MKASGTLREYKVVGRCLPTPKCRTPPLYRMHIFSPNHVFAKPRFWYFVSQLKKMNKSSGEIVYCGQVFERSPLRVKNFGIWLRYDSGSGTHNMYREYRDLTTAGAVTQCYRDMVPGAHSIQIMKVRRSQPTSAAGLQSSSSMTPRASSHCPIGSSVASISHGSPPSGPTLSSRPLCLIPVCPIKLLGD
ncbi:PREDICTED: 60S ribosomal protein L18a-like [Elephantulus edwardii]|uniref:60S ribosomal protein L18a-like n=1 Tax=Elephantulus edwardii TaxID=28737 RepID=UPI0003F08100|nr:PREDICTED: 60S ribosomal protein L18a-like [Elephantulus edwardii]